MPSLIDKTIVVGPFQCNCRVLVCPTTGHAVLVDPGDEAQKIIQVLSGLKTETGAVIDVKYLFHTHAHLDHIGATRAVAEHLEKTEHKPLIALHQEDEPIYQQLKMQGTMFGMTYDDPLPITHYLKHEEDLQVGTMKFSVIHTPGHSPGGVCFRLHEDSKQQIRETLFSGDTLFQGSVGRTDLWGANQEQMFKSIKQRILTLDGDTRVCPGHGPETSVGIEKKANPFLR